MSSFVISKEEYIKAAGFFAGIAEQKNYYKESVIYWWSYNKKRILTSEDYYNAFSQLYEINAVSVMRQYGDKAKETDPKDYKQTFIRYWSKAADLYRNVSFGSSSARLDFQKAVFDFFNFTRSVNYQIEDRKLAADANKFLHKCNSMLLGVLYQMNHHESDCWGSFSIFDEKEEA